MTEIKAKSSTIDAALIALFAALSVVCSWISVPFAVPFTLQTFAVFMAVGVLGTKKGTLSVFVYIMLGAVGLPVFAGFKGGVSALLGATGGYILGFIFSSLITGFIIDKFGSKIRVRAIAMGIGMLVCYAFGTAWFMFVYAKNTGPVSLYSALSMCVIPFVVPDALKIVAAAMISSRINNIINKQ